MKLFDKKNLAVFLFFAIGISGCAHVPVAEKPIELKRSYEGAFDTVWNAVFEVARRSDGAVITEDKSSGLVVYRIFDETSPYEKVYMQVYAKQFPAYSEVSVYLFPRDRSGYSFGEKERNFFEEMDKILLKSQNEQ